MSHALVELGKKADKQSEENARQEKILKLFTIVTVVFVSIDRKSEWPLKRQLMVYSRLPSHSCHRSMH